MCNLNKKQSEALGRALSCYLRTINDKDGADEQALIREIINIFGLREYIENDVLQSF